MTNLKIILGDCLDGLKQIPDSTIQCVITSPPYVALRDYGTAQWDGGDENCDHLAPQRQGATGDRANRTHTAVTPFKDVCGKCGAKRVDRQIGLEKLPWCDHWPHPKDGCQESYVCRLVAVARECRRILTPSGLFFLNVGDSYSGSGKGPSNSFTRDAAQLGSKQTTNSGSLASVNCGFVPAGLKPKDMMMVPERLAIALQEDGWYVRQRIIWAKGVSCTPAYSGSCMPESVDDRCTNSYEPVFMLAKSRDYFADMEGVKESGAEPERDRADRVGGATGDKVRHGEQAVMGASATRNMRSVWAVNPEPDDECFCAECETIYTRGEYKQLARRKDAKGKEIMVCRCGRDDRWTQHFAKMPSKLAKLCIQIGSSPRGCCPKCFAPWERVMEVVGQVSQKWGTSDAADCRPGNRDGEGDKGLRDGMVNVKKLAGWQPTCKCYGEPSEVETICGDCGGSGRERLYPQANRKDDSPYDVPCRTSGLKRNGGRAMTLIKEGGDGKEETGCECPKCDGKGKTVATRFDAAILKDVAVLPCKVVDPFGGSGTTAIAAMELGRDAILCELSPDYAKLANARCKITPGLALA